MVFENSITILFGILNTPFSGGLVEITVGAYEGIGSVVT
jgi:hypothetical protein